MRCSFNPRTHTGCDLQCEDRAHRIGQFQSTHPHGVRLPLPHNPKSYQSFNPRTHTGCDKSRPKRFLTIICFNPRTHTGCDQDAWVRDYPDSVSIHAPTRGATDIPIIYILFSCVSIHAPTRGATTIFAYRTYYSCFNPRTHTGCDPVVVRNACTQIKFQSTHPHGVRREYAAFWQCNECFNPRTHTGCDPGPYSLSERNRQFQSTHPHGVRRLLCNNRVCNQCFNPRTHTGCDHSLCKMVLHHLCFNPRTHTGCDQKMNGRANLRSGFNPRTHTGCDFYAEPYCVEDEFQSTHPHGVRRQIIY